MTETWAHRVEARTLPEATKHREEWTQADLEFVAAFADEATDEELALALGRSYYAIASIKQVLAERLTKEPAPRTEKQRLAEAPTYTFVDGDVPPGWW